MSPEFKEYVNQLVIAHRDERIYPFQYGGKKFWLKQPEKLKGIWLLLKPYPKQSFKNELQTLLNLVEKNAPVPIVPYHDEDFFVLEDAGATVSQWLCDKKVDNQQKFSIIYDACLALIDLHTKNLVHGRPAIRDITWDKGKVTFLDFESRSSSQNQNWLIVRDMLFFFNSLCREEDISDTFIQKVALYYQAHCEAKNWQNMMSFLQRFRWVYYLLLPFKSIAKTDLIAIYRLFEILLIKKK
ncbi:hypothetical protein [Haemophilus haemolyticus]|uniref:hypothetical protein n=1 Tax=Haemophilus haemolyticus TaxID=726 RepID=UPI000E587649|nr:hypothetical protein [Haemophilus haemolyticus]